MYEHFMLRQSADFPGYPRHDVTGICHHYENRVGVVLHNLWDDRLNFNNIVVVINSILITH